MHSCDRNSATAGCVSSCGRLVFLSFLSLFFTFPRFRPSSSAPFLLPWRRALGAFDCGCVTHLVRAIFAQRCHFFTRVLSSLSLAFVCLFFWTLPVVVHISTYYSSVCLGGRSPLDRDTDGGGVACIRDLCVLDSFTALHPNCGLGATGHFASGCFSLFPFSLMGDRLVMFSRGWWRSCVPCKTHARADWNKMEKTGFLTFYARTSRISAPNQTPASLILVKLATYTLLFGCISNINTLFWRLQKGATPEGHKLSFWDPMADDKQRTYSSAWILFFSGGIITGYTSFLGDYVFLWRLKTTVRSRYRTCFFSIFRVGNLVFYFIFKTALFRFVIAFTFVFFQCDPPCFLLFLRKTKNNHHP